MSVARGISLKILATLAFTAMSALVRLASSRGYPTGEIVFFRSFFALVPLFLWLGWKGHIPDAFTIRSFAGHVKRGLIGCTSMAFGFAALAMLPLADAVALGYATPLAVAVLAGVMLGERVSAIRWLSVVIGFFGVLLILSPHFDVSAQASRHGLIGSVCALVGAVSAALAVINIRRLVSTETTASIVMVFMLMCALMGLLTLPFGWTLPGWGDFALLVTLGVLGGLGQILVTTGYRYGDASLLASFDYVSMLWAIAFGLVLFGDWPSWPVLVGSAVVITSSLALIFIERRREAKQNARSP